MSFDERSLAVAFTVTACVLFANCDSGLPAGGSAGGTSISSGGVGNGGIGGKGGSVAETGGKTSTSGGLGQGGVAGSGLGGSIESGGTAGGANGGGGIAGATGGNDAGVDTRVPDSQISDLAGDTSGDGSSKEVAVGDLSKGDVTGAPLDGGSTCNLSGSATSKTPTLYVIGDSTASVYSSNLYPRMGWAQPLQDSFAPACVTVADKALSGRSSKSFWNEGAWTPIKSALRAGDFVIIQFGHNDEKSADATLYTDPFTSYEDYLSRYIDDTIAKGATPILATSINRNQWSGATLQDTHGDYPVAMRELAQKKKVALVDATLLTKTYFERIGQAATTKLFMDLAPGEYPNYPNGNTDNTHLQETGARTIARMILADLYRQSLTPGTLAKTIPVAP